MANQTCSKEDSPWMSKEWRDTILLYSQENRIFRDESFPPNESSLDGRPRTVVSSIESKPPILKNPYKKSNTTAVMKDRPATINRTDTPAVLTVVVYCKCGIPASLKTVQSDGPNYARPFLSCGRPYSKTSLHNRCNFFQWDSRAIRIQDGGGQASSSTKWTHKITWFHILPPMTDMSSPFCISRQGPSYHNVQQGRLLGNCWFLSALAAVAEKPFLIHRLIPIRHLNTVGCYIVNFYLDGCWESILIDSYLPIIGEDHPSSSSTVENTNAHPSSIAKLQPAFAAWPRGILWPALVEKAYAKVHGSYSTLHGGFISEAFQDLTGAPTERLYLSRYRLWNSMIHVEQSSHYQGAEIPTDVDELWVKLLSFSSAGFVMGAATSTGGDGIVPCHAYSILNILEIHNAIQGEQRKLTDFFDTSDANMNHRKRKHYQEVLDKREILEVQSSDDDEEVIFLGTSNTATSMSNKISTTIESEETFHDTTMESIRLVHIRNPWGHKEFKGAWSVNSEKWTSALRKQVGSASFQHGDGTFFMSLDEFITRFDHVDVSKCHEEWVHSSYNFAIMPLVDALLSSSHYFQIQVTTKTWAFLSVIQPKKRANTLSRYWYSDLSLLVLKRRLQVSSENNDWIGEKCVFQGVQRSCEIEMFLEPSYEYIAIPISFGWSRGDVTAIPSELDRTIRFAAYSSNPLIIQPIPSAKRLANPTINHSIILSCFHREVLRMSWKQVHILGPQCVLAVSQGSCCAYFLVLNASHTECVQLRLLLQTKHNNVCSVCGRMDDVYMIPPRTEKMCVVLVCDGREARVCSVLYSYFSDAIQKSTSQPTSSQRTEAMRDPSVGTVIDITIASDLIAGPVGSNYQNGKGELCFCIEQ